MLHNCNALKLFQLLALTLEMNWISSRMTRPFLYMVSGRILDRVSRIAGYRNFRKTRLFGQICRIVGRSLQITFLLLENVNVQLFKVEYCKNKTQDYGKCKFVCFVINRLRKFSRYPVVTFTRDILPDIRYPVITVD